MRASLSDSTSIARSSATPKSPHPPSTLRAVLQALLRGTLQQLLMERAVPMELLTVVMTPALLWQWQLG